MSPSNDVPMTEELMKKCTQAASYLQQDVFVEMFEVLEEQYVALWKSAKTTEEREAAWYQLQALYDVHKGFRILAEKKQVWEQQQKVQEERARRFKLALSK